jgi:hypothetical protein
MIQLNCRVFCCRLSHSAMPVFGLKRTASTVASDLRFVSVHHYGSLVTPRFLASSRSASPLDSTAILGSSNSGTLDIVGA